jgi:hypothetical protein
MDPEGLLLCPQEPATGSYPEPAESSPNPHVLFVCLHFFLFLRRSKESANFESSVIF